MKLGRKIRQNIFKSFFIALKKAINSNVQKKYEKMLSLTGSQGTANPNKNKIPFYKLSKTKKFVSATHNQKGR